MSDLYGPGAGAMLGLAWGRAIADRKEDQFFAAERARLRQAMEVKQAEGMAQTALAAATTDVANDIIDELAAQERGAPGARRLSDPARKSDRLEHFIETADEHLHRISSGRLSFSRQIVGNIKRSNDDVGEVAAQPTFRTGLEAQPNSRSNKR